jgi:hypothetical protein
VLATAGGGAADLSFYGFAVEVSGPVAGTLVLDELEVEDRLPAGLDWRINELRYADPALEFVELHGPAGPLPAGLVLRAYRASDGGVLAEWPLAGVVPDDGGGRGFLVAGDPGVPGVDLTNGFSATTDDLPDLDPGALELLLAPSGIVLDALVYEAFGGLDDLVRPSTLGVTERGPPWVGEVGPGTDAGGVPGSLGRWPDGRDTRVNGRDFSLQPASPGAQNGGSLALGARLSFETPPARAFQTYATFSVADPTLAGLPASTDGGRAYRCVDPAGGGVIGVLGDASLGAGSGCVVTGELYVPPSSDPPQAIAVGLGGRQGSTFFGPAPAANGYESGLWLIYENAPGVALADGRPDHPGVFELVVATHDNQDGAPVELLGSLSLAASGALEGTWVPFRLAIDPLRVIVEAQVNGVVLQRCSLPASVPRSGALEIGFRENHAGGPGPAEGTWVDGIVLSAP